MPIKINIPSQNAIETLMYKEDKIGLEQNRNENKQ